MNNNYLEHKKNTHLYFQIGENKYAINTSNVLEIMKLPALDYPQKLPNNIIGLLKYNNFVINVVDIRFYLNIEVTPYDSHKELLETESRNVLVRIIVPESEEARDNIIFATNNQTNIPKSSLRVTDTIHLQIEMYFKSRGLYYDRRKNYYKIWRPYAFW